MHTERSSRPAFRSTCRDEAQASHLKLLQQLVGASDNLPCAACCVDYRGTTTLAAVFHRLKNPVGVFGSRASWVSWLSSVELHPEALGNRRCGSRPVPAVRCSGGCRYGPSDVRICTLHQAAIPPRSITAS